MYLLLIRNKPCGKAVHGGLYESYRAADGEVHRRCIAQTLENADYLIPALIYPISVSMSPRFKRPLPLVENVPGRTGIRFHRGTRPEHSKGCILLSEADEKHLTDILLQAKRNREECRISINP